MTAALATLLVRLLGAYCVFTGVYTFVEYADHFSRVGSVTDPDSNWSMTLGLYVYAGLGVFGVALWTFARFVSAFLIGPPAPADQPIKPDDLVSAGSFLIGLYWSATHLPEAIYMSLYYSEAYARSLEVSLPWLNVGLGILMMLGAQLIATMFRSLRKLARSIEAD